MNARRRYVAVSFLTWFPPGLYIPASVLLMLDRGLSLPTIAAIGTVYSLCVAFLELPTGGLADVLGRQPVLIAAALAGLASLTIFAFATTAAAFVASAVLQGTSRALGSGPAEAWYVDTLHAQQGPEADLGPGLAHGNVAGSVALTVGTLIGGFLPLLLVGQVAVPLAVPILLAAAAQAVRLVLTVVAMPEPRHARPSLKAVLRGVPENILEGLRIGRRDGVIARLLLIWGAIGVALATVELLTPAWMAKVTGENESAGTAYAIVAALGFAASSLGSALSMRLLRLTATPARAGVAGLTVMAVALLGLAATTFLGDLTAIVAAGLAYFAIFVGLGAATPHMSTLQHQRTASAQRATVISMQSLSLQICGAFGALTFAAVATQAGPGWAFLLTGVVVAASGLLMRRPTPMPALSPTLEP